MSDFDDFQQTLSVHRPTVLRVKRVAVQVLTGKEAGRRFELDERVRVGAKPLADLVLKDPKVSGLHCELIAGEHLRVRDLGSKNGTFVGSVQIVEAMVAPGDTLTVGDTRLKVIAAEGTSELPLHSEDQLHGLVGRSPQMRALTARLLVLAASPTTVLIQGETGTGKERVAEALHLSGPRAPGPLVTVDCGALPSTLIESELFGHERGAFTGAVTSQAGAFERAEGGTLFLDEIGELPLELQPKLLRALESRTVRRLGGQRALDVDVRIVAATNRDLAVEVAAGRFREDLYYRLAVVTLLVPPLRERLDDLPLLVRHLAGDMGVDAAPFLTDEALAALARHGWPGNVRELRNVIERAAVLAEPLQPGAVAEKPAAHTVDLGLPFRVGKKRLVDAYEREYVTAMLAACGGNVSEAARRAGIERISMYRTLQRLGLKK